MPNATFILTIKAHTECVYETYGDRHLVIFRYTLDGF